MGVTPPTGTQLSPIDKALGTIELIRASLAEIKAAATRSLEDFVRLCAEIETLEQRIERLEAAVREAEQ